MNLLGPSSITADGDTTVLTPVGSIVSTNREELKGAVIELLRRPIPPARIVIDCGDIGYIDSSGLGVLLTLSRKAKEAGSQLVVRDLNDDLRMLFDLTRLDTHITVEKATEAAGEAAR